MTDEACDARFNQDSSCLVVCLPNGFRIYNCNPFSLVTTRDFSAVSHGRIHTVEMLYCCNILAIVGAAPGNDVYPHDPANGPPRWCANVLVLWDDKEEREVAHLVFSTPICNVKLLRRLIVVAVEDEVYVYQLSSVKLLYTFPTCYNPNGICEVATNDNVDIITFPGPERGTVGVQVCQFDDSGEKILVEDHVTIPAHQSDICCIALSVDGLLLVTASASGPLVRLWGSFSGAKLQEFRKASCSGWIRLCRISHDSRLLCMVSDRHVVSLFRVNFLSKRHRRRNAHPLSPVISTWATYGFPCAPLPKQSPCLLGSFLQWTCASADVQRAHARHRLAEPVVACTFLPNTNNLLVVLPSGAVHRLCAAGGLAPLAAHAL
ncbi:autophagy-related protein 18, putative [Babesia caballi]|uniref:Autophagy-related protein 18, putative n=1 Tax=Babesia caballi TaxID=5871 RepID=A0AAV4LZY6_BABCB|nr:autophagy-related protein 18, putative [Babesia caballi]